MPKECKCHRTDLTLMLLTTQQGFCWRDYTWTHLWVNSMLDKSAQRLKICPKEWITLTMKPWNESSDRKIAVKSWRNKFCPGSLVLYGHYLSRSFNMLWRWCLIRRTLTLRILQTRRFWFPFVRALLLSMENGT